MGDIIREVNGYPVATPEQLMDIIMESDSNIMLKIIPSYNDHINPEPVSESSSTLFFSFILQL